MKLTDSINCIDINFIDVYAFHMHYEQRQYLPCDLIV